MEKILKIFAPGLLSIAIFLFLLPSSAFSSAQLDSSKSCAMNIKSGWNLVSLAELYCGLLKADSMNSDQVADLFPAYLDIYGYDGSEYIHARVIEQKVKNRGGDSLESAAEKYINKLVSRITSGRITANEDFMASAQKDIEQNNTQKIKEYAGRLNKEILTSVWVYNPGKSFSVEYFPKYNDDALTIFAIRALATDISSSDLSQFVNYIEEEILPETQRELEKQPGYSTFAKELVSGKVILDSGWNFLSYSRLLSDNNGRLNFGSGNCKISKAYVFNGNEKKWVSAESASRSMIGSGMVLYNSGSKCSLNPGNSILSSLQSLLRGGADNNPPSLPGEDKTPPPILPDIEG